MKTWHALILAASILVGCGLIAAALTVPLPRDRYHYSNVPVENRLTRIDRDTGAVEVYDRDRGWYVVGSR